MTKKFLLMSQQDDLVQQLQAICKKEHWTYELVTTPTGLVVALEKNQISGIWWDMTEVSLDTTIATMTLIRSQVQGPFWSPTLRNAFNENYTEHMLMI